MKKTQINTANIRHGFTRINTVFFHHEVHEGHEDRLRKISFY